MQATPDERKVFLRVNRILGDLEALGVPADRISKMKRAVRARAEMGREQYGGLDLATETRDMGQQAGQEACDYIFYAAADAIQHPEHAGRLDASIAMVATAWAGAQEGES